MKNDPLNILSPSKDEEDSASSSAPSARQILRKEAQAKYERLWLQNPEKFNPMRTCLKQEDLNRAWKMIKEAKPLKGMRAVDLGCGYGILTLRMRDAGAELVDAVDIASQALRKLELHDMTRIRPFQDYVPYTHLEDNAYDLVVCTELIAELPLGNIGCSFQNSAVSSSKMESLSALLRLIFTPMTPWKNSVFWPKPNLSAKRGI